jgi:hypothetical protein
LARGPAAGVDGRRAFGAAASAAAVLGEVGDQRVHRVEVGAVDDVAAVLRGPDQPRVRQFLQVKRQRRRGDVEPPGDGTGGKPGWTGLDQQAEQREARLLRERGEPGDGVGVVIGFHVSNIIEI